MIINLLNYLENSSIKFRNKIAVEEVARQLRLRDMGEIIIVDFIDLNNANNRKIIYENAYEKHFANILFYLPFYVIRSLQIMNIVYNEYINNN